MALRQEIEAAAASREHGHKMTSYRVREDGDKVSSCKECGMNVVVRDRFKDFVGGATEMRCDPPTKKVADPAPQEVPMTQTIVPVEEAGFKTVTLPSGKVVRVAIRGGAA